MKDGVSLYDLPKQNALMLYADGRKKEFRVALIKREGFWAGPTEIQLLGVKGELIGRQAFGPWVYMEPFK